MILRLQAFLFACIFLLACSSRGHSVTVRLVSDISPGVEAASVVAELRSGELNAQSRVLAHHEKTITRTDAISRGVDVATIENVATGTNTFFVALFRANGERIAGRPIVVDVQGDATYTIVVSADCATVECPAAGSPSLSACLAGQCVDPRCSVETPEFCPAFDFCASDADCNGESSATCATQKCSSGVCIETPNDDLCADTEYCARGEGCAPVDMPQMPGGDDPRCGRVCIPAGVECVYGYYQCTNSDVICTPFLARPAGAPCGEGNTCDARGECVATTTLDGGVESDAQINTPLDAASDARSDTSVLDAAPRDASADGPRDASGEAATPPFIFSYGGGECSGWLEGFAEGCRATYSYGCGPTGFVPTHDVHLDFSTSAPDDVSLSVATITFPAGTPCGDTQNVTIELIDDELPEPREKIDVAYAIRTDDSRFTTGSTDVFTRVPIVDDDTAPEMTCDNRWLRALPMQSVAMCASNTVAAVGGAAGSFPGVRAYGYSSGSLPWTLAEGASVTTRNGEHMLFCEPDGATFHAYDLSDGSLEGAFEYAYGTTGWRATPALAVQPTGDALVTTSTATAPWSLNADGTDITGETAATVLIRHDATGHYVGHRVLTNVDFDLAPIALNDGRWLIVIDNSASSTTADFGAFSVDAHFTAAVFFSADLTSFEVLARDNMFLGATSTSVAAVPGTDDFILSTPSGVLRLIDDARSVASIGWSGCLGDLLGVSSTHIYIGTGTSRGASFCHTQIPDDPALTYPFVIAKLNMSTGEIDSVRVIATNGVRPVFAVSPDDHAYFALEYDSEEEATFWDECAWISSPSGTMLIAL